jgi:hypothetical protein
LRKSRTAVVLAASLAAHAVLLTVWMNTRPDPHMVEPPVMQIELLRPPPREASKPRRPSPPPRETPLHLHIPAGPAPADLAGPPLPPTAPAPRPLDPRQMTDQELLAGGRPDLAKIYADEARQPLTRKGMPTGCKPATEHSDRIAQPCAVWAGGPILHDPAGQLPNRPEMAAEGRYKDAMKKYHEAPGGAGYPGMACALGHRC